MKEHPDLIKERLISLIYDMSMSSSLYVKNPEKDFTRDRKLTFETVMHLLISMGGNSIYKELLESLGYNVQTATTSAFTQQRDKILSLAFEFLLHEFTEQHTVLKKYQGYRLLAVDGSDLHIATDPNDPNTYYQAKPDSKGYNLLHLNAMYDLKNRLYVDSITQPSKLQNEKKALNDMIDRSRIKDKVIIVADRNYEGYNNFAHIEEKGWNYVIRVKDLGSTGILSGLKLPSGGEFDITINRILTRKRTNEIKANPDIYRYISHSSAFDFLDSTNHFYPISFRIVRFKLADGSYQTVITNLDLFSFPPKELKKIYKMRWGIETSFRELKYSIGLTNFHAKKQEYIAQEIFARIIMYNFTEMITSQVIVSKFDTKYPHKVNFSIAVSVCRKFLGFLSDVTPSDVEALIRKNTSPVRPDRQNTRNIRSKSAVSFVYRVA